MFFLKPIISPWIAATALGILATLAVIAFRKQHNELPVRIRATLLLLRISAFIFLTTWLLQPCRRTQAPKAGASQLGILLDASPSMSACRDCPPQSQTSHTRWEEGTIVLKSIPQTLSTSIWRFCSGELFPFDAGVQPAPLPGNTDIGSALNALLQEATRPGALPLQSVLLISDGRQWGDAIGAARQFAAKGIPISTLCLGNAQNTSDVSISFGNETPSSVLIHEQAEAFLHVRNTFSEDKNAKVTLRTAQGNATASCKITIPAGKQEIVTLPFPISDTIGEAIFSASIEVEQNEGNPINNQAKHILTYDKPPKLHVLFMASNPDWEWRFIRKALENTENIALSALIRLGLSDTENEKLPQEWQPNLRFYKLDCDCGDAFPSSAEFYKNYEAVIMPCESASALDEAERNALRHFVERQGGGLLWLGDASLLPSDMKNLIPGENFENRTSGLSDKVILASDDFLFTELFVQPTNIVSRSKYTVCHSPRKITRTVLRDERGAALLLAEGNYGAGRVAWNGLSESWRWAFNDSGALHAEFWKQLVMWLSANRQPQLELDLPDTGLIANRANEIAIRVLGPDFTPAQAANVRLTINGHEITIIPDLRESGRYFGLFTPSTADVVTLHFQVKCSQESEALTLDKYLMVNASGQELSELSPDETLMNDIARITGGQALTLPINWKKLPQSKKIPRIVTENPLFPDCLMLLPAAMLLLLEYAIRRRNAQK